MSNGSIEWSMDLPLDTFRESIPLSADEKAERLADAAWYLEPLLWLRGTARKLKAPARWHFASIGEGQPPTEEGAYQGIAREVAYLLKYKDVRLHEAAVVYDVFRYFASHHPELCEDDWYELAALKLHMTRGQVETAVRVASEYGLCEMDVTIT